jgi:hypothetical protein
MMNKDVQESIARLKDRVTSAKSEKRKYFRLSLRLPMEYSFRIRPATVLPIRSISLKVVINV